MTVKKKRTSYLIQMLVLSAFIISSTNSYAQPPGADGPPPSGERNGPPELTADEIADTQSSWMKKQLKLNKDQVVKVKAINTYYAYRKQDYEKTFQPPKSNTPKPAAGNAVDNKAAQPDDSREKLQHQLDALNKEKDNDLKQVFTEKQYDSYLKKKVSLEEGLNATKNGGMPPPPEGGI